ncbi:MAG: family 2A encapsulin nanocompartment cargo protein cysteine desulfurase, partial [Terriglobales bacterium]
MSINITNTSEPETSAEDVGKTQLANAAPQDANVPDVTLIAKLANEFFQARPGVEPTALPADQFESDSLAIPANIPSGAGIPDLPREVFSFPRVPTPPSVAGVPESTSSPAGVLSEADFRAIAASLAGATGLIPQSTAVAPPVVTLPADEESNGPWSQAPAIPSAKDAYSFPGVPSMPSAPQTGTPGAGQMAAAFPSPAITPASAPGIPVTGSQASPWTNPPALPGSQEAYSFPRVPGASLPGAPEPSATSPALASAKPVSTAPPTAQSVSFIPNVTAASPPVPETVTTALLPQTAPKTEGTNESTKSFGLPTSFPAISSMFSFPGVPGVQSPPGVPVVPSSIPTKLPEEKDARDTVTTPAGVPLPQIPAVSQSQTSAPVASATPGNTEIPKGTESVEFHPDVVPDLGVSKRPLDPRLIRQDFPILQERIHGRQLVWLDNAATTQKPNAVIDRLSAFYRHENSNVHRAAHTLAARATDAYESAREKSRRFLNASSTKEIIFVRGTTEGINLVAQSWGRRNVYKDDEIVITWLEHHANIVPWQQLCAEKGARLRVAPVNDRGEIILEQYERLLSPRTKMVAFSQVSNALGTVTPAREMVEMAHRYGARVLVDGAQSVSHMRTDVQALDCDFFVFSGHKIFGPTGIGVVFGKLDLLNDTPPWQGGGNMIADVTFEKTTYQDAPARFEAGTGNIADAVGLGAAIDYVEQIGIESIFAYEHELLEYGTAGLLTVPGLRLIGTAREKAGVMSFVLDDVRTEDVGAALNQEGIAVRSGHHCAQPILRRMGVEATVRPSLAFYNTK